VRRIVWVVLVGLAAGPASAADVLVVCPPEFRPALKPWVRDRSSRGHTFAWIGNEGTAEDVRDRIRKAAGSSGRARFLVLVGDADPAMKDDPAVRARSVPTHFAAAKANLPWSRDRDIATDNWYADLDDDQLPDLAVGRLPVDTPAELATVVRKILDYERNTDFGAWRRRISFVACPGDFGGVIDSVIEQGARRLTTEGIPPSYATTAMYGHWRSPYCPDPRRFCEEALGRINEGALFWVYIGHGHCRTVDHVTLPDRTAHPILRYDDVRTLECRSGQPIAVFLACHTGRFDDPEDSIAEEMLRTPGAPVAIVAATRVTMPYAMTVMGGELMRGYFEQRIETIGELVREAKRQMVLRPRDTASARVLDALAVALNPRSPNPALERMEHVLLFHLIGDPTMRLPHAEEAKIESPGRATAGAELVVHCESPLAGTCVVELAPPRDKLPFQPPVRRRFSPSEELLGELHETYRRANETVLASTVLDVDAGPFEATLQVPLTHTGAGHVRVYIEGRTGYALGSKDVWIEKGSTSEAP
jgi:hypothetical protein